MDLFNFFQKPFVYIIVFVFADDLGHFEVDIRSGDIRTTSRFSQKPQTNYTLTVVVTDNGPAPLQETAVIHLQVLTPVHAGTVLSSLYYTLQR